MSEWRRWRERSGLTQEQVAQRLGVSRAHYSRLENGVRTMDLDVARALASVYGLSPAEKVHLLSMPPAQQDAA